MPLGQGIGEMWSAVQGRIEVGGHGPTWHVTAGSFDSALAFAREAFGEVVVLGRKDRDRWWPRVTLTVTTDLAAAASAPRLEDIAQPVVPPQPTPASRSRREGRRQRSSEGLPASLEEIFAHQEELRIAQQRIPQQSGPAGARQKAPAQNTGV